MRIRDIDINEIQTVLTEAKSHADNIRNKLGLPNLSASDVNFYQYINNALKALNFDVIYTGKLEEVNVHGHVPAITKFYHQTDRSHGGKIFIYNKYSERKKNELLLHEFIHIYDDFTPWSTDNTNGENAYKLTKLIIKAVELRTELISLALMMPIEEFQNNLLLHSYDIIKIASLYRVVKPSSIAKWLILHDDYFAHYAIIIFNNIVSESKLIVDEYHSSNTAFNIQDILYNENSIAFNSRKCRTDISGISTIDNQSYHCFCFYENDVKHPLPSSVSKKEKTITCDEMVIIGWSKNLYDIIKNLKAQP